MADGNLTALLRIGNEDVASATGGDYVHLNPVSGEPQGTIPLAGKAEMDKAVEKAADAFEAWRRWKPEARREVLLKLGDLIRQNIPEFARLAALDGGTHLMAGAGMAMLSAEWHTYYAGWCDKLGGEVYSTFDTRDEFSYSTPEPYGVVGIIITWNGPVISLGMKVAPALAAGNCVVVKPAELTPFAPDLYARLVREAGVPDGVFSLLPGGIEAGEALVNHPKVEKISFTGGPIAARKIMVACAEQLKPCVLELGGKSASLLFPDADIDAACARAVQWSIGIMAGQGCALPTRLLVHDSIYETAIEKCIEIAKTYKVGDPFEEGVRVGPLINAAACDRVMGMLDRVRSEKSGRIVMGGGRCGDPWPEIALAHGLAIAVMVSATGQISGGHLNPAVTFGALLGGKIDGASAARYIVSQLIGAALAGYVCLGIFGLDGVIGGTPQVADNISAIKAIGIEAILTFFLVFVVFGTGIDARGPKIGGLAIGLTVALDILFGGPLTGAAMNPARTFGPAIAANFWVNHYVYWLGPLIGGGLAGLVWKAFLLPKE